MDRVLSSMTFASQQTNHSTIFAFERMDSSAIVLSDEPTKRVAEMPASARVI
jgi:hypothetical protein